ncbi:MAG: hypothetical protein QM534_05125 [Sediminibacterium sp.]|nr:hypothetical protein [Sediminibacterium sp.]
MKKHILLLLLSISSLFMAQKNPDYTAYNDAMLSIEACNSRASFDSSITKYYHLFSKYELAFAKDAYNACQIAALKNHKYFHHFFYKCAQSGITKTRLLSNPLIKTAYISDSVNLNTLYSKGNTEYTKRIDMGLREEMLKRAAKEQESKGKQNYAQVCTDNFNRILELTKSGNYPGEFLIGVSEDIESIIFPTFCHYPYSYIALSSYWPDALKKGHITPFSLLYLYGFNQTRRSVLYVADIPTDSTHFKIPYNMPYGNQSTDFAEVNRQRTLKKVISMAVQNNLRNLRSTYGLDYLMGYY